MPRGEPRTIDVIGDARFVEEVKEYVVDLVVQVRAPKRETVLKDLSELQRNCVQYLVTSGMRREEIVYGGSEVWRPWYWIDTGAKEAEHTITIRTPDIERLTGALSGLESIFENQRYSFTVRMRCPVFAATADAVLIAHREALRAARTRAGVLAEEIGAQLLDVMQIEEVAPNPANGLSTRPARRERDRAGDAEGAPQRQRSSGTGEDGRVRTEPPTRTVRVAYRVRFALK